MDAIAIPLKEINKAISIMKYASTERVMFEMLVFTGCRISELNHMRVEGLQGNVIYWKLGKNQKKYRKVELPTSYVEELKEYRQNNKTYCSKLFGVDNRTFVRYFNRKIRLLLGCDWLKYDDDPFQCNIKQYVYQLKGLRKSYATIRFWGEYKRWDDPVMAMEMASKDMKHSTAHITCYHYLRNFKDLGIKPNSPLFGISELGKIIQTKVTDY